MSSPNSNSRHSGLSYASIAAGTIARNGGSSAHATYSYAPPDPQRFHMSRQERRHSVRAELDAEEPGGSAAWQRQSNGASSAQDGSVSSPSNNNESAFFVPTYLTRSRHVQQLKHEWEEQRRIAHPAKESTPGHLGTSSGRSSATNLHKVRSVSPVPHVHRGVSHRVLERPSAHYPHPVSRLRELPTRWHHSDKAVGLDILGDDSSEVRFSGGQFKTQDDAACIRSDASIPSEIGLYYYEITVMSRGKDVPIGVGLAMQRTMLSRPPGWEPDSYAYHGDDGDIYSGKSNGRSFGPHWNGYDVVGCGINFRTNTIFFTKNGVSLGNAFTDVKPGEYHPFIGFKKIGDHVRTNFGRQPFVFDIDTMMEQERQMVSGLISAQSVANLHPPDDETTLIQNLIGQYLAHDGYVDTSRAFQQDLMNRRRLAPSTLDDSGTQDSADDVHAMHRQRIRRAMLDGDVDRALKYTQTYYPLVLRDPKNKWIYFRLRCRRFIEMMRRWSELSTANALMYMHNGHQDERADTQMELDEQLQREATAEAEQNGADMDTSTDAQRSPASKESELLEAAVKYGQGLREEFESDSQPEYMQELEEVFALIAYNDARSSDEVRHLVDKSGRSTLAEELNGAILVSLGKPSSAALENLCSQTQSFLDSVARRNGGAAAFVNVRQDFLHSSRET